MAPKKQQKHRKEKATRNEVVILMDFIEALMVRRLQDRQIIRLAEKEHQLGERQTRRYMAAVRKRWREEADATGREERRDHLRASLNDAYGKALATTKTKPDPDVPAALKAAKLLMDLDALAAPTKVDLTGTLGVASAQVPMKTRAGLEAWLRGERAPAEPKT